MSLQPKTRKYRVSFRNKTYKKANLLANRDCAVITGFTDKYWHLENNKTFKKALNLKTSNYNYSTQYKTNFTDSVSFITTKNKNVQFLLKKGKHPQICNNWAHECYNRCATKSISISNYNDSSSIFTGISSGLWFTEATIDKIRFGQCGLYFCSPGTITAKFIETVRLAISRKLKKAGRFWIRVCPDTPVTARSAETRMGRGKGAISHYEAKVKEGQIFIEFCGVPENSINQIYLGLSKKSPIKLKLIA